MNTNRPLLAIFVTIGTPHFCKFNSRFLPGKFLTMGLFDCLKWSIREKSNFIYHQSWWRSLAFLKCCPSKLAAFQWGPVSLSTHSTASSISYQIWPNLQRQVRQGELNRQTTRSLLKISPIDFVIKFKKNNFKTFKIVYCVLKSKFGEFYDTNLQETQNSVVQLDSFIFGLTLLQNFCRKTWY